MLKTAITCAAVLGAALWANFEKSGADEVSVKRSPTAPWIEVYHDGELSAEWHPRDGAIYQALDMLLKDELGYDVERVDRSRVQLAQNEKP